ncbi:hypothetical protein FHX44_11159 [Pseudonocardia hierapolitana]|uniref:Uncharacterized protein n=1 Tax=Pseudonocardia hierapolitana TaxID=1128676 RepID=A0A561SHE4_9PSEU|nr:hypothetical protein FHX44_11159 [Pseudonocardia hierapolitana]
MTRIEIQIGVVFASSARPSITASPSRTADAHRGPKTWAGVVPSTLRKAAPKALGVR